MGFSERTRLIENCKVMHCFSRIGDFHSTYAPLSKRNLNLDPNFGNKDRSSRLTILACDFGPARAVDFRFSRDAESVRDLFDHHRDGSRSHSGDGSSE